MWQAKDLWKGVFGSVAMIGLTGGFFGSVARKGLKAEASDVWQKGKVEGRRQKLKRGEQRVAAHPTPPLNGKECGSD